MQKTFSLTISTPEGTIYTGDVASISFTSEGGDLQVFSNHAALTTVLLFTPVSVVDAEGNKNEYVARRGLFYFDNTNNRAVLLALYAQPQAEMDLKTAEEYLAFVEEKLKEGADLSEFQLSYLEGQKLAVERQLAQSE